VRGTMRDVKRVSNKKLADYGWIERIFCRLMGQWVAQYGIMSKKEVGVVWMKIILVLFIDIKDCVVIMGVNVLGTLK